MDVLDGATYRQFCEKRGVPLKSAGPGFEMLMDVLVYPGDNWSVTEKYGDSRQQAIDMLGKRIGFLVDFVMRLSPRKYVDEKIAGRIIACGGLLKGHVKQLADNFGIRDYNELAEDVVFEMDKAEVMGYKGNDFAGPLPTTKSKITKKGNRIIQRLGSLELAVREILEDGVGRNGREKIGSLDSHSLFRIMQFSSIYTLYFKELQRVGAGSKTMARLAERFRRIRDLAEIYLENPDTGHDLEMMSNTSLKPETRLDYWDERNLKIGHEINFVHGRDMENWEEIGDLLDKEMEDRDISFLDKF